MIVGIVAAILLAAGLLPPYFELWKRSGRVVGINFLFLAIDWLGAFFSLMGVVAQNTFDPLGGCLFIVCIFIEGGIFVAHGIWLFRTRKLRAAAKTAGRDFDELPDPDVHHVDTAEKGSIASSRDVERDEIPRRANVALARDLELGAGTGTSIPQLVIEGCGKELDATTAVEVKCEEVSADSSEGVQGTDYGTMESSLAASRTRPGFKRQDTNATCSKNLQW